MTWLDVWYGFVAAIVVTIGRWLIQGMWLGTGDVAIWAAGGIGAFIGVAAGRPAWRAFAANRKA